MRALCVHVVPLAEDELGRRWPEMDDEAEIEVVGCVSVIEVAIEGEPRLLLLGAEANR